MQEQAGLRTSELETQVERLNDQVLALQHTIRLKDQEIQALRRQVTEEQKINVRMRKAEPSVKQAKQIQAQVRQITKLSEDLRSARESNQAQQLKAVAAKTAEKGYQQQIA